MRLTVTEDLAAFARLVLPWLATDPVRNSVQLTVIGNRLDGYAADTVPPLWSWIEHDGAVVGVATRLAPFPLALSPMSDAAARAAASRLYADSLDLPGVTGPIGPTSAFAAEWSALSGAGSTVAMAQRLYRLDRLLPARPVDGEPRPATEADLDLAVGWAERMGAEVHPHEPPVGREPLAAGLRQRIALGLLALWEVDGAVVSMTGSSRPAAGVVRLMLVYTPPEHRRRGYAAALVSAVTRKALDAGAEACALYTDLANPTSNSVYTKLGYRPVGDAQELSFGTP